jgi:hypothetical protein
MRISSSADLKKFQKSGVDTLSGSGMSDWASRQIEAALAAEENKAAAEKTPASGGGEARKSKTIIQGESPGEISVRLALTAAFGDWHRGGEVVQELIPFQTRRFRCDFALPRWRFYCEVDGWSHHGKSLDDHHSDRERGLFFSSHDWLPFRVSHDQAINSPGILVDAIAAAMKFRQPVTRESIQLEQVQHKHGAWYRLQYNTK